MMSDAIGLIGVSMILISYYFLIVGKLVYDNIFYLGLNVLGPILILFSLIFHFNISSFAIEIIFCFINVVGIWKYYHKDKND